MNKGLKEVLTALENELYISDIADDRIVLKRSEYDFAVITRADFCDKRTLDKYWGVMRTLQIIPAGSNQFSAILDVQRFCDVMGLIRKPAESKIIRGREAAACRISE